MWVTLERVNPGHTRVCPDPTVPTFYSGVWLFLTKLASRSSPTLQPTAPSAFSLHTEQSTVHTARVSVPVFFLAPATHQAVPECCESFRCSSPCLSIRSISIAALSHSCWLRSSVKDKSSKKEVALSHKTLYFQLRTHIGNWIIPFQVRINFTLSNPLWPIFFQNLFCMHRKEFWILIWF